MVKFFNLINKKNILKLKFHFNVVRLRLNTIFFFKKVNQVQLKHNKIFLVNSVKVLSVIRKRSKFYQKSYYIASYFLRKKKRDFINLYKQFINLVFKEGKKSFWEKSLALLFFILKKKLNYSKNFILLKLFLRLHTKVEMRIVKSRKRINLIPFFIKFKRRCFLSLKWLLEAAKKNKQKTSLKQNLLVEILFLLRKKSCISLNLLEENNLLSYKNRANMHFRW
jgi:small subunit ribosomal protein S7